jgi:phosphatidylserine decarboxylase
MSYYFELLQFYSMGDFSVTQICSRTRDWPACVTPAKNNFVCVSIVKREKRMQVEGRCAERYPATEHPHA